MNNSKNELIITDSPVVQGMRLNEPQNCWDRFNAVIEESQLLWEEAQKKEEVFDKEAKEVSIIYDDIVYAKEKLKRVNWSIVSEEETSEVLSAVQNMIDFFQTRRNTLEELFQSTCTLMENSMKRLIPFLEQGNKQSTIAAMFLLAKPEFYRIYIKTANSNYGFEHPEADWIREIESHIDRIEIDDSPNARKTEESTGNSQCILIKEPDWDHDFDF